MVNNKIMRLLASKLKISLFFLGKKILPLASPPVVMSMLEVIQQDLSYSCFNCLGASFDELLLSYDQFDCFILCVCVRLG